MCDAYCNVEIIELWLITLKFTRYRLKSIFFRQTDRGKFVGRWEFSHACYKINRIGVTGTTTSVFIIVYLAGGNYDIPHYNQDSSNYLRGVLVTSSRHDCVLGYVQKDNRQCLDDAKM